MDVIAVECPDWEHKLPWLLVSEYIKFDVDKVIAKNEAYAKRLANYGLCAKWPDTD